MAYSRVGSRAYDRGSSSRKGLTRSVVGGAGLAFVALACAWSIYANLFGADPVVTAPPAALTAPTTPTASTTPVVPTATTEPTMPPIDPDTYVLLFDSTYFSSASFGALTGGAPLHLADLLAAPASSQGAIAMMPDVPTPPPAGRRLVQSVPLPTPRPLEIRAPESRNPSLHARAQRNKAVADTADDKPTIFERLFGKPQTSGQTLAYAAPDGGVSGDGQSITPGRSGLYDRWTAVYDISAHTVYMPDGTKLEAHSGLGSRLDDPGHVHERMRGATPPHIYDLAPREALFHGVRALRLIPVGGENPFGRTGLLAHSYMLGPNGDSNGCVSFRDYNAFLRAYMNREVKRLVVVPRA
jgi:Protein of unknown function (DUF2778)